MRILYATNLQKLNLHVIVFQQNRVNDVTKEMYNKCTKRVNDYFYSIVVEATKTFLMWGNYPKHTVYLIKTVKSLDGILLIFIRKQRTLIQRCSVRYRYCSKKLITLRLTSEQTHIFRIVSKQFIRTSLRFIAPTTEFSCNRSDESI